MSQPYVGEIRMFGGNFAPQGWLFCDGQILSIAENEVLFNLIGTTFGGDGQNTFAVPDLRGRIPVHQGASSGGPSRALGELDGQENVTLTTSQLPAHYHATLSIAQASSGSPAGKLPGVTNKPLYAAPQGAASFNNDGHLRVGGGQAHDNMMPFQSINFIISLFGIFPNPS